MSKHLAYYLLINTLIACLLGWHTYTRYNDFKDHHTALANESVNSLSLEISNFIIERQRLVTLFAREHKTLIQQLIKQPDNEQLKATIYRKITAYFPEAFTFTIASEKGVPYLVDFEGKIGELCEQDIAEFSSSMQNNPQIHPGIDAYHFDIMSFLETETGEIIFFISFHADMLGHIISAIETPNHRLQLIVKNERMLLEVTKDGARNKTIRNDYRLNSDESKAILASKPVNNSRWIAIDAHEPQLFSDYLEKSLIENSVFLLFSLIITAFFNYKIKKEEELRLIAENSKNDFLSIVSHELRTPLTSLHGAISLLSENKLNITQEKAQQMLDIAKRNTSQLLLLVNEILDFRKIESGNVEYNFQPADINEIIQEAIDGMNDYAKQYGASIVYLKHKDPVNVQVDRTRIIQVANNLISNALKYGAANDSVIVEIALSDGYVRVSFQDNGPGIPDDFAGKVFDKFTQANIRNKTKGSTGLGLNIAKTFIDAHHGNINFTTSTEGTTFYFELPIYK